MSRALYRHGTRDARVAPFNLRKGKSGEALPEVTAVGPCGSDLHDYKDGSIGSATIKQLFVPGRGLKDGDLVVVDPNHACGRCAQCRAGHPNLCANVGFIGAPPFDGADAVPASRIGGRIMLVGIPDGDTYMLPAVEARRRGLKIKFARRMGEIYPRAIALVAEGRVDVESMISHRFTLDETPEAFRLHTENAPGMIKSLILPIGEEGRSPQ